MTSFKRFLLLCLVGATLLCGCRAHHITTTETVSTTRLDGITTLDAIVQLITPRLTNPTLQIPSGEIPAQTPTALPDTSTLIIHATANTTSTEEDTTTHWSTAARTVPPGKRVNHPYGIPSVAIDTRLVYLLAAIGLAFWLLLWRLLTKKL